jgi:hypothetical protein
MNNSITTFLLGLGLGCLFTQLFQTRSGQSDKTNEVDAKEYMNNRLRLMELSKDIVSWDPRGAKLILEAFLRNEPNEEIVKLMKTCAEKLMVE